MCFQKLAFTTAYLVAALLLSAALLSASGQGLSRESHSPSPTITLEDGPRLARTFGKMSSREFRAWLKTALPPAMPLAKRDELIASAPLDARIAIINDEDTRVRLEQQAFPILDIFGRANVVRFIIYWQPKPMIRTMPGAYIALSTGLIERLKTEAQLNGFIAHELAHIITAKRYQKAWAEQDMATLRKIELLSDAIATSALITLGMNHDEYKDLLACVVNYSSESTSANDGRHDFPALQTRLELIDDISRHLLPGSSPLLMQ